MFYQMMSSGSGAREIVASESLKLVPFFPQRRILSKQVLFKLQMFILANEWLKVTNTIFVFSSAYILSHSISNSLNFSVLYLSNSCLQSSYCRYTLFLSSFPLRGSVLPSARFFMIFINSSFIYLSRFSFLLGS